MTRYSTGLSASFRCKHCHAKAALGEYPGVMGKNQGVGNFEAYDLNFAFSYKIRAGAYFTGVNLGPYKLVP